MIRLSLCLALIFSCACAPKQPIKVFRFKTCIHNGDHEVCECNHYHEELNARVGRVGVCE